jgi:hypothetical protein
MKDVVIDNSLAAFACFQSARAIRKLFKQADESLVQFSSYSFSERFLEFAVRSVRHAIGEFYVNADIIKASLCNVRKFLYLMINGVKGFMCRIYLNSYFMEITERAVVNSRWLRSR